MIFSRHDALIIARVADRLVDSRQITCKITRDTGETLPQSIGLVINVRDKKPVQSDVEAQRPTRCVAIVNLFRRRRTLTRGALPGCVTCSGGGVDGKAEPRRSDAIVRVARSSSLKACVSRWTENDRLRLPRRVPPPRFPSALLSGTGGISFCLSFSRPLPSPPLSLSVVQISSRYRNYLARSN